MTPGVRTFAWWAGSLTGGLALGLVAAMVLLAACAPTTAAASTTGAKLRQHAATPAHAPTAAGVAACVPHYNHESTVNYSTSNGVTVWSSSGWTRTLYDWDTCQGGAQIRFSIDADCHLRARLQEVGASGVPYGPSAVIADRGGTCNARPGKLTFQTNGAVKTWSGAGTQLSATPYMSSSPFQWKIFCYFDTSSCGEQTLQWWVGHGTYVDFWFGPAWNI